MNTACIFFSYAGDAGLVTISAGQALRLGAAVTVADDGRNPMPEATTETLRAMGCRVIATHFIRKGNLNGTECVVAMLDVFRDAANAHAADYLVKLDPDTWLCSLAWLPQHGEAGAGFDHRGIWMGCYALRADVIADLRRGVIHDKWSCRLPEAFAIGRHLQRLGAVVHPAAGRLAGWEPDLQADGHDVLLMGRWPQWAREEGMRRLARLTGEPES